MSRGRTSDNQAKCRLTCANNEICRSVPAQLYAAESGPMWRFPEYTRNENHRIRPGQIRKTRSPGTPAGASCLAKSVLHPFAPPLVIPLQAVRVNPVPHLRAVTRPLGRLHEAAGPRTLDRDRGPQQSGRPGPAPGRRPVPDRGASPGRRRAGAAALARRPFAQDKATAASSTSPIRRGPAPCRRPAAG